MRYARMVFDAAVVGALAGALFGVSWPVAGVLCFWAFSSAMLETASRDGS